MKDELIRTVQARDVDSLRKLLSSGATTERSRNSALKAAVQNGFASGIRVLVEHGADIRHRDEQTTWSLIHTAVEQRQPGALEELIRLGADVNARDGQGWTPLHLAVDLEADTAEQNAGEANDHSIALLICLGADPTIVNNEGQTPLDMAEAWGNAALADALRTSSR